MELIKKYVETEKQKCYDENIVLMNCNIKERRTFENQIKPDRT